MDIKTWLTKNYPSTNTEVKPQTTLESNTWKEIRIFLSSTFIDTQGERDNIIKRVIPNLNRKLLSRYIRVVPVDLRWGVLTDESKDYKAIQKTCLNQLDKCRMELGENPWFIGLRTGRYGWIQNALGESKDFDQKKNCAWLDNFAAYGKNVSITSLECIHASMPPKTMTKSPTVFFYKRHIRNPDEIEENFRWVFDFEYVDNNAQLDPKLQYQYTKTDKASMYKEDQEKLDEYLRSLGNVKYSTYECCYQKGGAQLTGKTECGKMFGVGYVSELTQFEEQVEKDLMEAITKNFKETKTPGMSEYNFQSIQHENAVRLKGATFVGRANLMEDVWNHCVYNGSGREDFSKPDTPNEKKKCRKSNKLGVSIAIIKHNVLVLHGLPGRGKSALLAAISTRSLKELREKGEFVFVHAVDSCPGSSSLEEMLRRLQVNLRRYRKYSLGETDLPEEPPEDVGNLKDEHLNFLAESAVKHPTRSFIILIDAVNQLHETMQAWNMWWLPSEAPQNIRIIISTLNEENNTFKNTCKACPNALKIPVGAMSYEDRQYVVADLLSRYNKKLTTENDPFLGNQMADLLKKNDSVLYLISATEALRRFGIYEQVTEYIQKLPDSIPKLFQFLLNGWTNEYGEQFIKDVTCLLCVSKDGLLENQINDILSYNESKKGFLYESSFSRLYDSVSSFLAAGGGGFLRFFHDQLKFVVKDAFLTPQVARALHKRLSDFHLSCIRSQLFEEPIEKPASYYTHCLQQVVYHQIETIGPDKESVDFSDTLRNIYFVRERVINQQDETLQQEYINAIKRSNDNNETKALKQWKKFVQLYAPYIRQFPEWSYNMAKNQIQTSCVATDTSMLPEPEVSEEYSLYWRNNKCKEDAVVMKYTSEKCWRCVASTPERNLCFIGGSDANFCSDKRDEVFLYEGNSGVLIHKVKVDGHAISVFLSNKHNTFWVGDAKGHITIWNVETGKEEWKEEVWSDEDEKNEENKEDEGDEGGKEEHKDYEEDGEDEEDEEGEEDEEDGEDEGHDDDEDVEEDEWDLWGIYEDEGEGDGEWRYARWIVWIGDVGEYVACATKKGRISIVDEDRKKVIRSWSTELYCFSYCFHEYKNVILTGHDGIIKAWNVDGCLVKTICVDVEGYGSNILYLSSSPKEDRIVFQLLGSEEEDDEKQEAGEDEELNVCIKQLNYSTEEVLTTIPDTGQLVIYDLTGDNLISTGKDSHNIIVYGTDGKLQNKIKGHSSDIHGMSLIPGTNELLTAADDGSMLFHVPLLPDDNINEESSDAIIIWSDFLPGDDQFVTLNEEGRVQLWNTSSCEPVIHVNIEGAQKAALHPNGSCLLVCSRSTAYVLNTLNLEILSSCVEPECVDIQHIKCSPDGTKCVVVTLSNGAFVLDIRNVKDITTCAIYEDKDEVMFCCDIHADNAQVLIGGDFRLYMLNMLNGEMRRRLMWSCEENPCISIDYVQFLYETERILYACHNSFGGCGCNVHIINCDHVKLLTFDSYCYSNLTPIRNGTQLITFEIDNSFRIHDTVTGNILCSFINHRSEGFSCCLVHPSNKMLIAWNKNKLPYILWNT